MRSYTLRALLGAVLAVGLVACGAAAAGEQQASAPADPTAEAQHYAQVRDYTAAVTLNQTIAWNTAAFWAGIELLAENYVPPPPPPPVVPPHPTGHSSKQAPAPKATTGGVCGGAGVNDQFIGRESGGNPNAVNPKSGAFGCWQLLPSTAAGCGIGPGASIAAQAACAGSLSSSNWTCCEGSPPAKP